MASSVVVLGRLGRPHGIKGEIRVDFHAESPALLDGPLWLRPGAGEPRPIRLLSRRYWKDQLVVSLEGVTDRSAAELLRGQELLVDSALLPEADEDEPYLRDILGLPVTLSATGEEVGVLEDVTFPGGQEIWSIRAPQDKGGYEILFPAVPELVDAVDLHTGQIRISPPPGLLELYQPTAKNSD